MKTVNIRPKLRLKQTPPANLSENDRHLFNLDQEISLPELNIYQLPNAELFEDGSIFNKHQLFRPSIRDEGMLKIYSMWTYLKRKISYKKNNLKPENYISILDHWSHEYYHWFLEALPRLVVLLEFYKEQNIKPVLILSDRYKKNFITDSLIYFENDLKEIVYLSKKSYTNIPLTTCDFIGPSDWHRGEYLLKLRTYFLKETKPFRKIYLSRLHARYRKVLNENELTTKLIEEGFEVIFAEELNLKQQIDLFSETKILITNHGAGLTNILFMPKNSTVIEFRKNSWGVIPKTKQRETSKFYNTYMNMCQALEINYLYQACESKNLNESCHTADITIDLDNTVQLLRRLN